MFQQMDETKTAIMQVMNQIIIEQKQMMLSQNENLMKQNKIVNEQSQMIQIIMKKQAKQDERLKVLLSKNNVNASVDFQ